MRDIRKVNEALIDFWYQKLGGTKSATFKGLDQGEIKRTIRNSFSEIPGRRFQSFNLISMSNVFFFTYIGSKKTFPLRNPNEIIKYNTEQFKLLVLGNVDVPTSLTQSTCPPPVKFFLVFFHNTV